VSHVERMEEEKGKKSSRRDVGDFILIRRRINPGQKEIASGPRGGKEDEKEKRDKIENFGA